MEDLGLAAEADDPAVKLGGFRHIHGEDEVLFPVGEQHGAAAEPVHDHIDQALVEPHFHGDGLPVEHMETLLGVVVQGLAGELRAGGALPGQQGDAVHPVHPVGGDAVAGGEGQKVAVLIVLVEAVGAGGIVPVPVFRLAVQSPVEVAEGDLPVLENGLLDGVHIIVDGLVHVLDPPGHHHIPADLLGLLLAAQTAELIDELQGLLLGEEPAGLHRADEQLQFRQLELALADIVAAVFATVDEDINAEVLQCGNVRIDGFPVTEDSVALQHFRKLRCSHRVILVGVFLQVVQDIQNFQLLVIRFWQLHPILSWFCIPL